MRQNYGSANGFVAVFQTLLAYSHNVAAITVTRLEFVCNLGYFWIPIATFLKKYEVAQRNGGF